MRDAPASRSQWTLDESCLLLRNFSCFLPLALSHAIDGDILMPGDWSASLVRSTWTAVSHVVMFTWSHWLTQSHETIHWTLVEAMRKFDDENTRSWLLAVQTSASGSGDSVGHIENESPEARCNHHFQWVTGEVDERAVESRMKLYSQGRMEMMFTGVHMIMWDGPSVYTCWRELKWLRQGTVESTCNLHASQVQWLTPRTSGGVSASSHLLLTASSCSSATYFSPLSPLSAFIFNKVPEKRIFTLTSFILAQAGIPKDIKQHSSIGEFLAFQRAPFFRSSKCHLLCWCSLFLLSPWPASSYTGPHAPHIFTTKMKMMMTMHLTRSRTNQVLLSVSNLFVFLLLTVHMSPATR